MKELSSIKPWLVQNWLLVLCAVLLLGAIAMDLKLWALAANDPVGTGMLVFFHLAGFGIGFAITASILVDKRNERRRAGGKRY